MNSDRELLIEILARLRNQDQIRNAEAASKDCPDRENFRVRFNSEHEKTKQTVEAFMKAIRDSLN